MAPALPEGTAVRGAGPGAAAVSGSDTYGRCGTFMWNDFRDGLRVVPGSAGHARRAVLHPRMRNGDYPSRANRLGECRPCGSLPRTLMMGCTAAAARGYGTGMGGCAPGAAAGRGARAGAGPAAAAAGAG